MASWTLPLLLPAEIVLEESSWYVALCMQRVKSLQAIQHVFKAILIFILHLGDLGPLRLSRYDSACWIPNIQLLFPQCIEEARQNVG